jgi:hypothetical protein
MLTHAPTARISRPAIGIVGSDPAAGDPSDDVTPRVPATPTQTPATATAASGANRRRRDGGTGSFAGTAGSFMAMRRRTSSHCRSSSPSPHARVNASTNRSRGSVDRPSVVAMVLAGSASR